MPLRIRPLWTLLIGFIVLMASNAWLKGIFGVGEIATDVPFLLTGLTLFGIWKFNRRRGNRNTLMGSARFGDRRDLAKLEGSGDLIIG
ncbi:MAG: type IV secretory system conjugative DNA transfer family protein, partial [Methylobacterium mesophilicum]|nr:type IV secretory system conjugative DNA transfer family protein [Methylobacterium mesophilicum]